MKKLQYIILFLLFGQLAFAQSVTPLSKAQSEEVAAVLIDAATSIKTLECRFVQQKTMAMLAEPTVSEGTMHYASPDRMRWEYTSPYSFALVVNGEQITRITEGQAEVLDSKSSMMYQGLANIIIGSASGRNLFDKSMFDVVLYDDEALWKAEMTPKRREMKRMFAKLVFYFEKATRTIKKVDFIETGGDVTEIGFEDIKTNEEIDGKVFEQ